MFFHLHGEITPRDDHFYHISPISNRLFDLNRTCFLSKSIELTDLAMQVGKHSKIYRAKIY